jgi:hypothetical protein
MASAATWVAILLVYATAFRSQPFVLYGLLCLIIGLFICTLVHEAGHALVALACDWRVVAFVVRPFGWQIPNGSFAIVPRKFRKGLGGWVVAVPRRIDSHEQERWSRILAAGPLASLLLAIMAFAAIPVLRVPSDYPGFDLERIILGLALQSLHMGVFAILPAAQPAVRSDGDQLRALRKAEGRYSLNRPIIWLHTLLAYKVRLRELPDWMLAEARNWPDSSEDAPAFLASIEIGRTLDAETVDVPRARDLIDRFRAAFGSNEWLAACDACLAAMWEADIDRANAALAERAGSAVTMPIFVAAEAAVAARMGDKVLARSKLKTMVSMRRLESPFADQTFRDIRRQIRALLA